MTTTAELIVTNARILTMDPEMPTAQAIAVTGDAIQAVGTAEDIDSLRGPSTRIIDANGNSVLPGFIEGAHAPVFGRRRTRSACICPAFTASRRWRMRSAPMPPNIPEKKVLVAQGADYTILSEDEPVTRHHLDRIIPDRPFAMASPDHHTMWANTVGAGTGRHPERPRARARQRDRHGRRWSGDGRTARGRGVPAGDGAGRRRARTVSGCRPAANPTPRRRLTSARSTARR